MHASSNPPYAGLFEIEGVNFDTCSLSRPVFCPFCMSPDSALFAGLVSFTARMGGDTVSNSEAMAAFVCPASHVFMVRQQDVIAMASQSERVGATQAGGNKNERQQ
jgi:hypothetical protein